jgi:hypothetical protein
MNNWRPDGWKNPHDRKYLKKIHGNKPYQLQDYESHIFEAGADAMLEALKNSEGSFHVARSAFMGKNNGTWVFILDQEDGK